MPEVKVDVDEQAVRALAGHPAVVAAMRAAAQRVAGYEASIAPKRSGAGAESIGVAPIPGRPGTFMVSWDRRHTYMGIVNGRRRFAEQAAARFGGR